MNCMQFYYVISDFISRVKEDPDRLTILNCPNTQQVTVRRCFQRTCSLLFDSQLSFQPAFTEIHVVGKNENLENFKLGNLKLEILHFSWKVPMEVGKFSTQY